MIRFVLLFILCLVILGSLYAYLITQFGNLLDLLLTITAILSAGMASVFAGDVVRVGSEVICDGFPVKIISECTGVLEMVILTSAIMAYPSSWRAKLIGLTGGNFLIYVLNLLRIAVLMIVGSHSQQAFKFMHLYFWQATLIIMISAVWIAWLYLVVYREKKSTLAVSG